MIALFKKTADVSWMPMIDLLESNFDFSKIESVLGDNVFPKQKNIFKAFKYTPLDKCRVVILGQDPYFSVNQANGLAFSVPTDVKPPSSLVNIFKNIKQDYKDVDIKSGNLKPWAKQGVLLLNCTLSVENGKPNSHAKLWKNITDFIITYISEQRKDIIFVLWGSNSLKKKELIKSKHILISSHPSGLSCKNKLGAYPSFMENHHFKQINDILKDKICWNI